MTSKATKKVVQNRIRKLTDSLRHIEAVTVHQRPYPIARTTTVDVDTSAVWRELEALRRSVNAIFNNQEIPFVKPFRFGKVNAIRPETHQRVGPSFTELSNWGILKMLSNTDGEIKFISNVHCEINGKWYGPSEEIEWPE